MCPPFLGTDLTGRAICPDSFMTKSAGCNTPEDRIYIEILSRDHIIMSTLTCLPVEC